MTVFDTESRKHKPIRRFKPAATLAMLALCGLALAGCVVYPAGYYGHGPSYYGYDDGHRGHWDHEGDRHRGWDRD